MRVAEPRTRKAAPERGATPGTAVGVHRWLGIGLVALAVGLVANSILGPLGAGVISYPFEETLLNQTIGLEAFSLLVALVAAVAGVLTLRGHPAAPVLAFGPAAYTWYMFLQYVLGPEYAYYPGALPLHLGLFALGGIVAVAAWAAIDPKALPASTPRTDRRRGIILLVPAAFLLMRYLPMAADALAGRPLADEFRSNVTMFWSIVLLDLGIVLPATLATAIGLLRGTPTAHKALYALAGWWALVPASVTAMAIAMVARADPYASIAQTVIFAVAAALFAAYPIALYWPLFHRNRVVA